MIGIEYLIEFLISLFDAILCVYFISRFNRAPLHPRKNKLLIPAIAVIFVFSVINDLFLSGFNVLGTIIFLCLYISYALLVSKKRYIHALLSACIFEIAYVLLSSLLYLIITFVIKDYDQLAQGSVGVFRYVYIIMHKIVLFVVLKILLIAFNQESGTDARLGGVAFVFSFITILGLGSTMYLASIVEAIQIQTQAMIITLSFASANIILYVLIYQMQKYQQSKYELKLLQEKISFEEARHADAQAIWTNVRKMQHDMKQHLSVLSGYLDKGEVEACQKYIGALMPSTTGINSLIHSDNMILDYLINSKLGGLRNTKIIISGSIGDLSDIKDIDLVCLMGNALDNAIEAIQRLRGAKEKRIELLFMRQNSNRIIICKNTIEGSVLKDNSELKSTKDTRSESHGFGTKIMAKIVSDYNGIIDYFEEFNMFGVQIVLPDPS